VPVLTTDDQVRRLRAVWYGTSDFRWPFDARYIAWATAVALVPVAFLALWLLVPVGVLVLAGAWAVGAGRRRETIGYLMTATVVGLALLVFPVGMLVGTIPGWLAVPSALAIGVVATRRLMPLVDSETPLRYWWTLLASEVRTARWVAPRSVAPTYAPRRWWQRRRSLSAEQVALLEAGVSSDLDPPVPAEREAA